MDYHWSSLNSFKFPCERDATQLMSDFIVLQFFDFLILSLVTVGVNRSNPAMIFL